MGAVFLIGAAQGLFLAVVLVSRPRNALPNRLLAALVLVFSVDLAMAVYHTSGMSTRYPVLIGTDMPISFLYGPLLYLYVRTLTSESHALHRSDAFHLVPFVAHAVFLLPFFLRPNAEKVMLMADPSQSFSTGALGVINPLKLVHGFVYLGLMSRLIRQHRHRVADTSSPVEQARLKWLRTLTIGVVAMLVSATVIYAFSASRAASLGMDPDAWYDDLTLLCVTVFVYALGYFGLRQPEITAHEEPTPGQTAETQREAYARSGMSPDEAERQRVRLIELMETEHLYRQGDLTVQDLAAALDISPHNLTEVLSTQLNQSFYEFVNGYRVRDVQRRLTDPDYAHWTVLAIGMESGFKAKSSFNAVFKRSAGMTPSQYRERHREAV
ncbi:MAG: helix-turn-helix transcriptional regulator [Bacteroidota bacterium]